MRFPDGGEHRDAVCARSGISTGKYRLRRRCPADRKRKREADRGLRRKDPKGEGYGEESIFGGRAGGPRLNTALVGLWT